METREETKSDWPGVDQLLRGAFGGHTEAELVARLRDDNLVVVSLVAEADAQIIGHIVLSALETQVDGRSIRAVALAPVAVRPDRQRGGIGSRLVTTAIERARQLGVEAIIVLGHPSYYPRFGFSAELARKLASPFAGPAFMALELAPGALAGEQGSVIYPRAFGL
jgi:putative acetyltransferase